MDTAFFQNKSFQWINFENPTREKLSELSEQYNFNALNIADSLEPGHLPKFEREGEQFFLLVRFYGKEEVHRSNVIREFTHKIGIFFSKNYIITIQQHKVPFWEELLTKLQSKNPADKVTVKDVVYRILSYTFNSYLDPSIRISEEIDRYEHLLFSGKSSRIKLQSMYKIKREAVSCKKTLAMMRDTLDEYATSTKSSSSIQDLRELNVKISHLHEQSIEDAQNLLSIYLSMSSQNTNEIMKLLTIFSAFFLPLTFIVGVYGMNFKYMPETEYKWGYPLVLIGMLVVVIFIYIWFKRKRIL